VRVMVHWSIGSTIRGSRSLNLWVLMGQFAVVRFGYRDVNKGPPVELPSLLGTPWIMHSSDATHVTDI